MDPILKKLNYRVGQEVIVIDLPQALEHLVKQWPESGAAIRHLASSHGANSQIPLPAQETSPALYLAFVFSETDVDQTLSLIAPTLKADTALWFAYPKKSSKRFKATISRDFGWQALGTLGYEPVRQIALDDDFSALRFKPVTEIKTLTRKPAMTLSQAAKDRLGDV